MPALAPVAGSAGEAELRCEPIIVMKPAEHRPGHDLNSAAWLARKLRQVVEAGPPSRFLAAMYLRIVLEAYSIPSFALSSNAIRPSPHSG